MSKHVVPRSLVRRVFPSLLAAALGSGGADAQTISSAGCDSAELFGYDDGGFESAWKISNPTGSGDAFSVNFDADLVGRAILGVALSTFETGSGGVLRFVAYSGDSSFSGTTPDFAAKIGPTNPTGLPGVGAGFCPGFVAYDTPDAPVSGNLHALMSMATGDSAVWLCADTSSAPVGRSYFTTNTYATTAIPFTVNWAIRAVVSPDTTAGSGGAFVINGTSAATIAQNANASLAFWTSCTSLPVLYLQCLNVGATLIPLPGVVLSTGLLNLAPGPFPSAGILCGPLPCAAPVGATFTFSAFWLDNCSFKKNGNHPLKLTPTASFTVAGGAACNPCLCFGLRDDALFDGIVWKVNNPAGLLDYFSVDLGQPPCAVTATSIQIASWDFCGTGPSWAEVGLYAASGVPGSPGTLVSNVLNAPMAPSAADWGYPATLYDIPDAPLTTSSSYVIVSLWPLGDSCIWMASDTDGTDDDGGNDCGSIPGQYSYFTVDGFATPAILFSAVNWMMRLDAQ